MRSPYDCRAIGDIHVFSRNTWDNHDDNAMFYYCKAIIEDYTHDSSVEKTWDSIVTSKSIHQRVHQSISSRNKHLLG